MSESDVQEELFELSENTWLLKFSIPKCHASKVTRATKYKITSYYLLVLYQKMLKTVNTYAETLLNNLVQTHPQ